MAFTPTPRVPARTGFDAPMGPPKPIPLANTPQAANPLLKAPPVNPLLKPPTPIAPPMGAPDARGGQVPTGGVQFHPRIISETSLWGGQGQPGGASVSPAPQSQIPLATSPSSTPYANIATNTPGSNTDYTNKTISPGQGTDRLALAKSNFENFAKSSEPEFQSALRTASQQAAGAGQIGSGMARGRFGDIGLAHAHDLDTARTSFLNDATSGGIEDSYRNIGIAQQQQGFQAGQQENAFGQAVTQQQLEEMLRSGAFGRSATTLGLGMSGNPSQLQSDLAGYYGNQASQAGQAAGSLLGNSQLQEYLKRYGNGIVPGTPDDQGVPQVTKGGLPIDIGSLIK